MRAGAKYILFLKAYPDDSDFARKYFPVDLEYGKYVISLEFPGNGIEALSNNHQKTCFATTYCVFSIFNYH